VKLGVLVSPDSWYFRDLQRAAGSRIELQALSFTQLAAGLLEQPWIASEPARRLDQFDAVLVRTMPPGSLEQIVFRMDVLHRLATNGTPVFNAPRCLEMSVDKYLTSSLLHAAGLPTPDTIVCQTVEQAVAAFDALGGDVVLKPLFGSEGRGIARLTDEAVAWRVFKSLASVGAVLYLQRFIPHPGWDLRLLVIGDQILAMRRRNPFDWRTNVSRGAQGEAIDPDPEHLDLARRAAAAVQASFVGVDLLQGEDGRVYVLEVNAVPGWRELARCLQHDVSQMVLAWMERQLGPTSPQATAAAVGKSNLAVEHPL
jgi:ribosomal protein S6--L-glutamate ligase